MKYDITASIVIYKNDPAMIEKAIDGVLKSTLKVRLMIIDNSPTDHLRLLAAKDFCDYKFLGANVGFGKGHNMAINSLASFSKYHLIINPDIIIPPGTLEALFAYMEQNVDVGLVIPKVLNFESEPQSVIKRLPSPSLLLLRRFAPFLKTMFTKLAAYYEMKDKNLNEIMEAPSVSGCFMLMRTDALKNIGLFDERFFMYMEDVDLSRRMYQKYRNVYNPSVHIYHGHARESYKFNRLLFIHLMSALKYFNKWGWIDHERQIINRNV